MYVFYIILLHLFCKRGYKESKIHIFVVCKQENVFYIFFLYFQEK